jgi:hypothetical protein
LNTLESWNFDLAADFAKLTEASIASQTEGGLTQPAATVEESNCLRCQRFAYLYFGGLRCACLLSPIPRLISWLPGPAS